ncbi:MAG: NADH-quinone oxidoreductase subunit C, partial [Bdellovibrionales bacterium]
LMDICGVDYPNREKRFEVVYHLFSSKDGSRLRIKVPLAVNETIPTALSVWRGADWFEREAYDMFGIIFEGHPNLRKILTHHQFVGHPLRKDYEANRQQHCSEVLPVHFDHTET